MEKLPKINILYEDNHLLVVIKPKNIPVQKDKSEDTDLLTILKYYLKEIFYYIDVYILNFKNKRIIWHTTSCILRYGNVCKKKMLWKNNKISFKKL